jgi:hypothetical protein
MAYKPTSQGNTTDKTYPSEIADARPILATRIHCSEESTDGEETMHRGGSAIDRMNEELNANRGGGFGRRGSR